MNAAIAPYAPPLHAGAPSPPNGDWFLEGKILVAKDGMTLPQVDLENGDLGNDMKANKRIYSRTGVPTTLMFTGVGGLLLYSIFRGLDVSWMITSVALLMGLFIWQIVKGFHETASNGRIVVHDFISTRRQKRATNGFLTRAILIGLGISLILASISLFSRNNTRVEYAFVCLVGGLLCFLVACVVSIFMRPKTSTLAGPPGWLKIGPVHPDALAYLMKLEQDGERG